MDIHPDINVEALVEEHPEAIGFLADRGIVCIQCGEPYWGTLRELAASKGLAPQIELIVADLHHHLEEHTVGSNAHT
jgi:hypothetical protein